MSKLLCVAMSRKWRIRCPLFRPEGPVQLSPGQRPGKPRKIASSPERATQRPALGLRCAALSGLSFICWILPRALPWALLRCPFGAEEPTNRRHGPLPNDSILESVVSCKVLIPYTGTPRPDEPEFFPQTVGNRERGFSYPRIVRRGRTKITDWKVRAPAKRNFRERSDRNV